MLRFLAALLLLLPLWAAPSEARVTTLGTTTSASGNGSTVNFPFPNGYCDKAHLVVTINNALKVMGPDYTVSQTNPFLTGSPTGGTVVFTVAPPAFSTVVIQRATPKTQPSAYTPTGPLPAATLEHNLDCLTYIAQETGAGTVGPPGPQGPPGSGPFVVSSMSTAATPLVNRLALIADVATAAGKTFYIPGGNGTCYQIDAEIPITDARGIIIFGDGQGRVNQLGAQTCIDQTTANANHFVYTATTPFQIRHIALGKTVTATGGAGIVLNSPGVVTFGGTQKTRIEDVGFLNLYNGVQSIASVFVTVRDSVFDNCKNRCIDWANTQNGDHGDNILDGNTFSSGPDTATAFFWSSGGGVRFTNNKVLGYSSAITLDVLADTQDVIIQGNSIESFQAFGMQILRSGGTASLLYLRILNNQFSRLGGLGGSPPAQQYCFANGVNSATVIIDTEIAHNDCTDVTIGFLFGGGTRVFVTDNHFLRIQTGDAQGIKTGGALASFYYGDGNTFTLVTTNVTGTVTPTPWPIAQGFQVQPFAAAPYFAAWPTALPAGTRCLEQTAAGAIQHAAGACGGGGGGGSIGGTIASTQVAVGSGADTISGSSAITSTAGKLNAKMCDTGGQVFNITCPPFNASPAASATANRVAIQAALDAAGAAAGGQVFCPAVGTFNIDAPGLDINGQGSPSKSRISIVTPAMPLTGAPCTWNYVSDHGSILTGPAQDFESVNMRYTYTSPNYGVGAPGVDDHLLSLAPASTCPIAGSVGQNIHLINTHIYGVGVNSAKSGIDFQCAYMVVIKGFLIGDVQVGIRGQETTCSGCAGHVVRVEDGAFNNALGIATVPIRMGGNNWLVSNVQFEPIRNGVDTIGAVQVTAVGVQGLAYLNNWHGLEGGSPTGKFFDAGTPGVTGGVFAGNFYGTGGSAVTAIDLGASSGITICDHINVNTAVVMTSATNVSFDCAPIAGALVGRPLGVSRWNDGNRWNFSAPLWTDAGSLDGVAYKGFGRASDDVTSITFYRHDRVTQTGFWSTMTTGFGIGGDGGYLLFGKNSGEIGIGTTSPAARLDVRGGNAIISTNLGTLPAQPGGTVLTVAAANGAPAFVTTDAYGLGATAAYQCRAARGTATSPTASQLNDQLCAMTGFGRGATAYSATPRASVGEYAAENWTDTAQGTLVTVGVTPLGSTTLTEALRVTGVTGGAGFRTEMSPVNSAPSFLNSRYFRVDTTSSGTRTATGTDFVTSNAFNVYIKNTDGSVAVSALGDKTSVNVGSHLVETTAFKGAALSLLGLIDVNSTNDNGGTPEKVGTAGYGFLTQGTGAALYGISGFAGVKSTVTNFVRAVPGQFELNCQKAACATTGYGLHVQNINSLYGQTVTSLAAVVTKARMGTNDISAGVPGADGEAWTYAWLHSTDDTAANARILYLNDGRLYLKPTAAFADAFTLTAPAGTNGANIKLEESGSQHKFIRNKSGNFEILDGSYANILLSIGNAGTITTNGTAAISVPSLIVRCEAATDKVRILTFVNGLLTSQGTCA